MIRRARGQNTSRKTHGTRCSALVNLNGYLCWSFNMLFLKKDYVILISFYHLPSESNQTHLNHSLTRTLEKKSMCFACFCLCTSPHTWPCEKEMDWLVFRGGEDAGLFLFFTICSDSWDPKSNSWGSLFRYPQGPHEAAVSMNGSILVLNQKVREQTKQRTVATEMRKREKMTLGAWKSTLRLF